MAAIELKLQGAGFKAWAEHIGGLASGDLKRIHQHAAWTFANHVRRKVSEAYAGASFPRKATTLERYARPPTPPSSSPDKTKGTPDPRSFPGARPLNRSGTMSRSVVVRRRSEASYLVQIDPKKLYPDGRPVAYIAELLEKGQTYGVPMTKATLAYLHAIRPDLRDGHKVKEGDTIIVKQQPRKVWEPIYKKLKSWRHVYQKAVRNWLIAHGKNPRSFRLPRK